MGGAARARGGSAGGPPLKQFVMSRASIYVDNSFHPCYCNTTNKRQRPEHGGIPPALSTELETKQGGHNGQVNNLQTYLPQRRR